MSDPAVPAKRGAEAVAGDASATAAAAAAAAAAGGDVPVVKRQRKSRFDAPAPKPSSAAVAAILSANATVSATAAALAAHRQATAAAAVPPPPASRAAGGAAAEGRKRKISAFIPEIRLNAAGQEIDAHGNVVKQTAGPVVSLRANARELARASNPYLAPGTAIGGIGSAGGRGSGRGRGRGRGRGAGAEGRGRGGRGGAPHPGLRVSRAFRFVEPGKLSKKADKERARLAREEIFGAPKLSWNSMHNSDKYGAAAATANTGNNGAGPVGGANAVALGARLVNGVPLPEREEDEAGVPDVEWWDAAFISKADRNAAAGITADGELLPKGTPPAPLSYTQCSLDNSKTRTYVEHPVPVQPIIQAREEVTLDLMLTKKERKRIRRQTRANREKEKQEAIQVGLLEPAAPKVSISNMMRVMGTEAVMDPTALEARVRKQVSQRIRNHDQRNAARKLTPAERREKKKKKYMEDVSSQVHVAVFRVDDLSNGGHRFKIDVNAHSWMLTGQAIICPAARSLVVVEGGPKGVRKFVRLIEQRIRWNGDDDLGLGGGDDEGGGAAGSGGAPKKFGGLVWQGTTVKRVFPAFKFEECNTAEAARAFMERKGVVQYWDMVAKHVVTQVPE